MLGGPLYPAWSEDWLSTWNPATPILSLRSVGDRLVPERAIDTFFDLNPRVKIQREYVAGDHLEGWRMDAARYKNLIGGFLSRL